MDLDGQDIQAFLDKYQPYFVEVRTHLVVTAILFVIGCGLGIVGSREILGLILRIFHVEGVQIIMTSPYQFIDLSLSLSLLCGILLASPYAAIRLYYFVRPALRPKERRFILSFLPLSGLLFFLGFGFGLWIMRLVMQVYMELNTGYAISSYWDVQRFVSQLIFTSLLTGLVFEIPIVISGLIRLRIIPYHTFSRQRRIVYAILIIIAILLPTTDILSLLLETLPLFFLFEFGLVLNRSYSLVRK